MDERRKQPTASRMLVVAASAATQNLRDRSYVGLRGVRIARHLFGSFARGDTTERSDVDLAVAGIEHLGYFPAIAELTRLLDSPVDLVELEQAGDSMLARIELEGIEL